MNQTTVLESYIPETRAHLPSSVDYIVENVLKNRDVMTPELAAAIVRDSGVEEEDLMPWADFSHPDSDSYGRKLLYNGKFFEIMVMSWVPGDISAIHDHGYTLWGAVKIFGEGEHAAFTVSDNRINTVIREVFPAGIVIPVGHELLHQLGNPHKDKRFLSLHMYGLYDSAFSMDSVTCDARVVDITNGEVLRTDGGMFFNLPAERAKSREPAPVPDAASWIRNTVETLRRAEKSETKDEEYISRIQSFLASADVFQKIRKDAEKYTDAGGFAVRKEQWDILRDELKHMADYQSAHRSSEDSFHTYAALYDEVIGKPCLDSFIARYIRFAADTFGLNLKESSLLSAGCGTGIMEKHLISREGMNPESLLGIDKSPAMVKVASSRIRAEEADLLKFSPEADFDIVFQGLNVFQYMGVRGFEGAVRKSADLLKKGGVFLGDFVTPDHIRLYPNLIVSENVISLRQPELIYNDSNTFQRSEIINVNILNGETSVTYEGKHLRYLPAVVKVRHLFRKYFGNKVFVYDALSLEKLKNTSDTSGSTRYIVIAVKE